MFLSLPAESIVVGLSRFIVLNVWQYFGDFNFLYKKLPVNTEIKCFWERNNLKAYSAPPRPPVVRVNRHKNYTYKQHWGGSQFLVHGIREGHNFLCWYEGRVITFQSYKISEFATLPPMIIFDRSLKNLKFVQQLEEVKMFFLGIAEETVWLSLSIYRWRALRKEKNEYVETFCCCEMSRGWKIFTFVPRYQHPAKLRSS